MSEADKQRRLAYKKNRQKWILIQIIAIALFAAVTFTLTAVFTNLNKTYYVSYIENGSADYNVSLKENEFYKDNSIQGGQGYIAELIDEIDTSFKYSMLINAEGVTYDYSRYIDARLEIKDKKTSKILYSPTYSLMSELSTAAKNSVSVYETASINYSEYDAIAKKFIATYNLTNVESRLVVTMHVNVRGTSDEFVGQANNEYSTSVIIPLCEKTIAIQTATSSPSGETKLLPCSRDVNPVVFKALAIVFAGLTLAAAAFLLVFIRLTRNEDIDYELKVKRLLNSYRSYIQILTNEFDSEGYQILTLATFNEMLGIRDTIQSPILMHENEDKTRTLFFIPTNTKILYVFEIKIDDYDEIYGKKPVEEELIEAQVTEETEASPSLDDIDYIEDDDMKKDEDAEVIDIV